MKHLRQVNPGKDAAKLGTVPAPKLSQVDKDAANNIINVVKKLSELQISHCGDLKLAIGPRGR